MLTVDQLMTKSLVNIEYGRSAIEAAKLMKTHKVGSVFVQKDNRIIGIVTEPDIIRKVVGAERVPYYVPVEEIMSSPVIGIDWRRPRRARRPCGARAIERHDRRGVVRAGIEAAGHRVHASAARRAPALLSTRYRDGGRLQPLARTRPRTARIGGVRFLRSGGEAARRWCVRA